MDKLSRKLLKTMNAKENPSTYICTFSLDQNCEYAKMAKALEIDQFELTKCVNMLVMSGYLIYCGLPSRSGYQSFSLSHKGLHYKEFQRIETWDFIKKSILVPILVSLVTAFITSCALNINESIFAFIKGLILKG